MQFRNSPLSRAVQSALTAGVAGAFIAPVAFAQDGDDKKKEATEVTGSRIKAIEIEGANPVTVYDRQALDVSGTISVSDFLRKIPYNSFGSFRERSGVSGGAASNATVDLRGIGQQRTLILVDGRRITATSAQFTSTTYNLNLIPLAAVERIEVLRDGASAVYGSDAMGGVVNIITRKDYEGLTVTARTASRDAGGEENAFSVVGGVSGGKGNLTFGIEHTEKDMIFNGDIDFASVGTSAFGFPPTFVDLNSTFVPDPRCPASLGSSSQFPNSELVGIFCRYNYAAVSANEAAITRNSMFVRGDFEISENTNFFARGIVAQNETFGRYAPTPFVGSTPFLPTIAASNPNNPTGVTGSFFYRNVPGGFRDAFTHDDLYDVVLGFEGDTDWLGGAEWEVAAQYSRNVIQETNKGNGLFSALQAAIDDGSFNPFGPASAVPGAATIDTFFDSVATSRGFDAELRWDLAQTGAGAVPIVVGFEYREESLTQDFDAQSNAQNVAGSAGGSDVVGDRDIKALYSEIKYPVTDTFEVNFALRFDDYSDFGSSTNPKLSAAWRPTEQLLIRGTYGTGFRAPSLFELFSAQSQSFDSAIDTLRCNATGQAGQAGLPAGHPCRATQYQNLSGGNPDLDAEDSDNWTVGIVWSPHDTATIGLDYYNIEITDRISSVSLQAILDAEAATGSSSSVIRNPVTGRITRVNIPFQNLGGLETEGVDLTGRWSFPIGDGEGVLRAAYSRVLNWKQADLVTDELETPFGAGSRTGDPWRAVAGFDWSQGDWSATLNVNHISDSESVGTAAVYDSWTTLDAQLSWAAPWGGTLTIGARNLTNEQPPCTSVTANALANGCRQPTTAELADGLTGDSPFYDNQKHDVYGRVAYIQYKHDF